MVLGREGVGSSEEDNLPPSPGVHSLETLVEVHQTSASSMRILA